ncbi:PepSY domain-containing protein [Aureimonas phyllosphaerae]|uniref:PepSY domain-containing protein n=1 Tax=Aureimonas phyllosphaerae TaxID=1166078 RepID=UPI003A5C15D4
MKRMVTLAGLIAASTTGMALADTPGADWIGRDRVASILSQQGYQMTKVEADDGHWEGEATRDGVTYEFHVDPRSGQVTKMERDKD